MSLTGRETVKPEEFFFAVSFFSSQANFVDTMLLFQQLDEGQDGLLDANELLWLIQNDPMIEKALSYKYNDNQKFGQQCFQNVAQVGGAFDRGIMAVSDELDLPKF